MIFTTARHGQGVIEDENDEQVSRLLRQIRMKTRKRKKPEEEEHPDDADEDGTCCNVWAMIFRQIRFLFNLREYN
jgi:hypothetical protein